MTDAYKGGYDAPVTTTPQALVAYIKGDQLIVIMASPVVSLPEALWALEGWTHKIVSEYGHKLVLGAILEPPIVDEVYRLLERIAKDNDLHIVRQSDWQGTVDN
jgi:hypothetical protein